MLCFVAQCVESSHCVIGLLQVQVGDVRVSIVLTLAGEGGLAREQLIGQNANGPVVNFVVVGLLVDQLRRHGIDCPAESRPSLVDRVRGPSEVA